MRVVELRREDLIDIIPPLLIIDALFFLFVFFLFFSFFNRFFCADQFVLKEEELMSLAMISVCIV